MIHLFITIFPCYSRYWFLGSRGVGWIVLGLGHHPGAMVPTLAGCQLLSRGGRCEYRASLHPRPSVHGDEPHPTGGDPVCAEYSRSKEVNFEK